MKGKRDFTAEHAIGHVAKEWREMASLAIKIRERRGSPVWIEEQEKRFTGIYKRLLTDPMDEVYSAAGRRGEYYA